MRSRPLTITVREFEEADRHALRHLYLASRNATFTWRALERHHAEDFDDDTKGERILVAIADSEIRGFASIWEVDSFLHNLFVHPRCMRQGIGQALLTRCDRYFHCTPTLKCLKANLNARRFYEAQGWRMLREEIGPDGPYLLMEKSDLTPAQSRP